MERTIFSTTRHWRSAAQHCPRCGGMLDVHRGCQSVRLACSGCGESFGLRELAAHLDDDLDEEMGHIPVDRL